MGSVHGGRFSGALPSDVMGGQGHCLGINSLLLSKGRAWWWPRTVAITTSLMVCQALYLALNPHKCHYHPHFKVEENRHRKANAPVQVHTAGGTGAEPSDLRAPRLVLPLPGGQLSWAMQEQRSGRAGDALLPKGPYRVWLSQLLPTGSHLDIRDSGLFIPIL